MIHKMAMATISSNIHRIDLEPSMACVFHSFKLLALVFSVVVAADNSPLQDFCVADMNGQSTFFISFVYIFNLFV